MQAANRDQVAGETGEQPPTSGRIASTIYKNPFLAEIADQYGRMVTVAILTGERKRAIDVVGQAFAILEMNQIDTDSGTASILGERIATILEQANIRTVGDLRGKTRNDLLAIRNVSWDTLRKIIYALQSHGYDLKK